jgi:hypothetical protein
MHVHTAPDIVPRRCDDLDLARAASRARMAGIVIKSHAFGTVARARLAKEMVDGVTVFGGLVLNETCGGLNPVAVRAQLDIGARVIWMPTVSAANHRAWTESTRAGEHERALTRFEPPGEGIRVTARDGRLQPGMAEILEHVAAADAILATGHISADETCALVPEAIRRGVTKVVVTHPEAPVVRMGRDVQIELAREGVMFERTLYSVLTGVSIEEVVEDTRAVGVESTILATDLGQHENPDPVAGFARYGELLAEAGLDEESWRVATATNPRRLLALED